MVSDLMKDQKDVSTIYQVCLWSILVNSNDLCFVRQSVANRSREGTPPLYSALVTQHLECWVQLWAPQYNRDMDILERTQWRATKMIKGLEHPSNIERLRAEFSLDEAQGVSRQCLQIPEGRVERGLSQALLNTDQGQDQRWWAQTETQEVPSEHEETLFHC